MPWLPSRQARQLGHLSACELMHLRDSGKLRFEKRGNAFFYHLEDVERLATARKKPAS